MTEVTSASSLSSPERETSSTFSELDERINAVALGAIDSSTTKIHPLRAFGNAACEFEKRACKGFDQGLDAAAKAVALGADALDNAGRGFVVVLKIAQDAPDVLGTHFKSSSLGVKLLGSSNPTPPPKTRPSYIRTAFDTDC